jgi:hypothetical protein
MCRASFHLEYGIQEFEICVVDEAQFRCYLETSRRDIGSFSRQRGIRDFAGSFSGRQSCDSCR